MGGWGGVVLRAERKMKTEVGRKERKRKGR